ncbi:MAG: DGQHR domain-containing protein [Oligoflexales bacterium]|nr:DGQHR domain-containing protein [Oligoflexales bacterium]
MIFKKPAAMVRQGSLTLFATSFTVGDFMRPDFYSIETLDPDESSSGYQRVLDSKRTKKISGYFHKAWKDGDAFLPTSVLLATEKTIEYDNRKNEITFDLEEVGPFNVVDGQHRIQGLISAAKQLPSLKEFEIATNIAVNVDEVAQMCHFLIVNTTQKSVDKAVEQTILSRLNNMINFKTIPSLPKWIQHQVDRGDDQQALSIIRYLNRNAESPWHQKIEMANQTEDLDKTTITQKSFALSLKRFILSSNNPLMHSDDVNMRNKILLNYWIALKNLLVRDDDKNSVIFKTNGINIFHFISPTVFSQLFNLRDFRVETIEHLLLSAFQKLGDEYGAISEPSWWKKGSVASSLNSSSIRKYASALNQAILCIDQKSLIQL